MTLIIAYILMSMVDAHWIFYPIVFVIWLVHCWLAYGERTINLKLEQ